MKISLIEGVFTDATADFRTSLPVNVVPIPKEMGSLTGYLRTADGISEFAEGPGIDRGGINWDNFCYRVMGTKLVRVNQGGSVDILGDVGAGIVAMSDRVSMTYSFDRLAVASGGRLYYWDGTTLTQVTDPDLGIVLDVMFIAGYFMFTDGEFIGVTDINNPLSVNPLKYASAEFDPDPVLGLFPLRKEAHVIGRYSIETFQNVGGTGFPFVPIDGAAIPKGAVGTHMRCQIAETFAFTGSGRGEPPGVYLAGSGAAQKLSTREIDEILQSYSEYQLSLSAMEYRALEGHQWLYIHLPNRTLVHDLAVSIAVGKSIWFELTSDLDTIGPYRARNFVYVYGLWLCGDTADGRVGFVDQDTPTQYDETIGYRFDSAMAFNEGLGAIVHSIELIGLPGRAPLGDSPVIFNSYTDDGVTYSTERSISAGKFGERNKRMQWRRQGKFELWRVQRFRGVGKAHVAFTRLEAQLEALNA